MILNRQTIKEMIEQKNLISKYVDIEKQLTPNGFDLTLKTVEIINTIGRIDWNNKKRDISRGSIQKPRHGEWKLFQGSYRITFSEYFRFPLDLIGKVRPRGSLVRCGTTIDAGIADAGWHGYFVAILVVHHTILIEQKARIAQMTFETLDKPTKKGYSGIYQSKK